VLQWIENNEREDLSLKERLGNLEAAIKEYTKMHPDIVITATILKDIISISLPQATYYMALISAPSDVK
jgi:ParB-like chromosome segregation protein Spo0J